MRAIALAGTMASGKSTVGSLLQASHGFTALAFGDIVRAEAVSRDIARDDRSALQALGQSLYVTLGAAGLVDRLLDSASGDIVVEGIRHLAVLEELRSRFPGLVFGFLDAPAAELDQRWQLRNEKINRARAASHEVESEIDELRDRADVAFNAATLTAASIASMLSAGSTSVFLD